MMDARLFPEAGSGLGRREEGGRAATLADVGRAAGVSAMAASAALKGGRSSTRVSDETRARVLAAAERLHYRPNATARALVERRMNTLGLVITLGGDEPNQYFLEVFNGILHAAAAAGQTAAVFTLDDWTDARRAIPGFCDGRIDGLILLAPMLAPEAAAWLPAHMPMVSVHANERLAGIPDLAADEEDGACRMVAQMLALGHRRIVHVAGPAGSRGADRRVAGYLRAHAQAGLKPASDLVVRTAFSADGGRAALDAWLAQHRGEPLPDAIFAGSDAIALGCIERLVARGLRVPSDLSVVGFDGTVLARASCMATVRQPLDELGRRAVALLLERIAMRRLAVAPAAPGDCLLPTEPSAGHTLAAPRGAPLFVC